MDAFMEALSKLFENVNADGFQNLILAISRAFANFDFRTSMDGYINLVTKLLDTFSFIWNPIWASINDILGELFGF